MEKKSRAVGSLLGLAIGDAIGAQIEFAKRDRVPLVIDMVGGGPHDLKPGQWTDDTSMALCLADSLIESDELNPIDLLDRFVRWYVDGYNSCKGYCFDIGTTTIVGLQHFYSQKMAVNRGEKVRIYPWCGDFNPSGDGNGSIMRLVPTVIRYHNNLELAKKNSVLQGRTTHGSEKTNMCCQLLSEILFKFINGEKKKDVIDLDLFTGMDRDEISSIGKAVDTLEASIWSVANTSSFKEAILLAVNLADDSDTVGAVTGQIAGALYGIENIPRKWIKRLAWNDLIIEKAEKLFEKGNMAAGLGIN